MSLPNWFITSDCHFENGGVHKDGEKYGIIKYCDSTRPFSTIKEHDEKLVENWNLTVGKKDHVIIVGDFAWKNANKWAQRLNGKKWLIIGNHDYLKTKDLSYFVKISEMLEKRILEQSFFFSHYAALTWPKKPYGSIMIHGHSHGRLIEDGKNKRFSAAVDVWDLRPAPIEAFIMKANEIPVLPFSDSNETKDRMDKIVLENLENNKLIMKNLVDY